MEHLCQLSQFPYSQGSVWEEEMEDDGELLYNFHLS